MSRKARSAAGPPTSQQFEAVTTRTAPIRRLTQQVIADPDAARCWPRTLRRSSASTLRMKVMKAMNCWAPSSTGVQPMPCRYRRRTRIRPAIQGRQRPPTHWPRHEDAFGSSSCLLTDENISQPRGYPVTRPQSPDVPAADRRTRTKRRASACRNCGRVAILAFGGFTWWRMDAVAERSADCVRETSAAVT